MLERIKQIMESKDLTASQFADAMEVPRAVVSHVLSGRNKPSLDVVLKIASTYSDVNLDWLLLGEGEMQNGIDPKFPGSKVVVDADTANHVVNTPIPGSDISIDKVQKIEPDSQTVLPADMMARSIKQVMIFYSDGTFETFGPAK